MHPAQTKIVERIISEMEKGVIPWRKQFETSKNGGKSLPYNAVTGREYSGFNVMVLLMSSYPVDGGWLTYKQAQAAGGHVKKGEKSTVIFYYSRQQSREKTADGDDKFYMLAKSYLVFHVSQCEGLDASKLYSTKPAFEGEAIDATTLRHNGAEAYVAATGARIVTQAVQNAFYAPSTDTIYIDEITSYENSQAYYSTLIHELIHWTGPRLSRKVANRFASHAYAFEELIAELGACFTLPQFGMSNEKNSAAYLQSWMKAFREKPEMLLTAASQASLANGFLNAFSGARAVDDEQEAQQEAA